MRLNSKYFRSAVLVSRSVQLTKPYLSEINQEFLAPASRISRGLVLLGARKTARKRLSDPEQGKGTGLGFRGRVRIFPLYFRGN